MPRTNYCTVQDKALQHWGWRLLPSPVDVHAPFIPKRAHHSVAEGAHERIRLVHTCHEGGRAGEQGAARQERQRQAHASASSGAAPGRHCRRCAPCQNGLPSAPKEPRVPGTETPRRTRQVQQCSSSAAVQLNRACPSATHRHGPARAHWTQTRSGRSTCERQPPMGHSVNTGCADCAHGPGSNGPSACPHQMVTTPVGLRILRHCS